MPTKFIFSKTTGRYRYASNGNVVPAERINGWIDSASKKMGENMAGIADDLRKGKINDAEWVIRMAEEIKNGHRAVALIAGGGRSNMSASDWGFIGSIIKRELNYLNGFANELANRPADAQLTQAFVSRAKSYSAAIYSTYEQMVRRRVLRDGQAAFEINILEGGAEHCAGCLEETARGKVPVGELVAVGHRDCAMRCRCRIEYLAE